MRKLLTGALGLLALGLLLRWDAGAAPNADAPWSPPLAITSPATAPFGASRPVLQSGPGGQALIVFNRQMSARADDNDPWYSLSRDGGASWSAPAPIFSSAANSLQAHAAFDKDGRAHAVWREGNGLAYAPTDAWGAGAARLLSEPAAEPGASSPVIVPGAPNRLDMVWSEGDGRSPDIVHAFSLDGGASWSPPAPVAATAASSLFPHAAADNAGALHVVWEEYDGPAVDGQPLPGTIYYARLADGAWTAPLNLSAVSGAPDARRPHILAGRDGLHVSYTVRARDLNNPNAPARQWAHHLECPAGCAAAANWASTANPVSGDALQTNPREPYDLVSSMAQRGSCTLLAFHGASAALALPNEVLWTVDSCDGWGGARAQLTPPTAPALFPSLGTARDGQTLLAYQAGASTPQIFVIGRASALRFTYLPLIGKR